jgi:hypothetical protein
MRSDQTNILTLCSAKRLGVLCGDKRSLNPVTLVAHLLLFVHYGLKSQLFTKRLNLPVDAQLAGV